MLVTDQDRISTYYRALLNRESSFAGVFYVGVRTTTVFCISTCRARKPKLENVEFYTSFKDALSAGYRPCKICKPTENASEAPEPIKLAIDMVRKNPKEKISDEMLRQQDISPEVLRRWFKKHYGMTFQSFQRMYRINNAFIEIKGGKNTVEAAFDSGYKSLSGFGYTYKKYVSKSPRLAKDVNIILINRITTPIGPMFICASSKGVCLLEFVDRKMLETEFKDIQRLLKAKILAGENQHITQAKTQLEEYFRGRRRVFDVTLDTPGSEFQQSVWSNLTQIPFGETCSYQDQAQMLNKPKAIRAVAAANGMNRVAIMIPCHRVIGKNGKLTGYGGGIERKKWLIEHESKHLVRAGITDDLFD